VYVQIAEERSALRIVVRTRRALLAARETEAEPGGQQDAEPRGVVAAPHR
jgi:hypothetical protein